MTSPASRESPHRATFEKLREDRLLKRLDVLAVTQCRRCEKAAAAFLHSAPLTFRHVDVFPIRD